MSRDDLKGLDINNLTAFENAVCNAAFAWAARRSDETLQAWAVWVWRKSDARERFPGETDESYSELCFGAVPSSHRYPDHYKAKCLTVFP
jgi:hypothetical protein